MKIYSNLKFIKVEDEQKPLKSVINGDNIKMDKMVSRDTNDDWRLTNPLKQTDEEKVSLFTLLLKT